MVESTLHWTMSQQMGAAPSDRAERSGRVTLEMGQSWRVGRSRGHDLRVAHEAVSGESLYVAFQETGVLVQRRQRENDATVWINPGWKGARELKVREIVVLGTGSSRVVLRVQDFRLVILIKVPNLPSFESGTADGGRMGHDAQLRITSLSDSEFVALIFAALGRTAVANGRVGRALYERWHGETTTGAFDRLMIKALSDRHRRVGRRQNKPQTLAEAAAGDFTGEEIAIVLRGPINE